MNEFSLSFSTSGLRLSTLPYQETNMECKNSSSLVDVNI